MSRFFRLIGFDIIFKNTFDHYLADFSYPIQRSYDILVAELYAIYKGLLVAKKMEIDKLVCYFDCLHCVNLVE
jgi:hypothetical protein